jgi:hypothetical protein
MRRIYGVADSSGNTPIDAYTYHNGCSRDPQSASADTPRAIPHQRNEVLIQPVFCEATPGAGTQGVHAGFVVLVGEESDNARGRVDLADLPNSCDSRRSRKIQIHQRHVGPVFGERLNGFLT